MDIETESQLIEQEHRLVRVILNLWRTRQMTNNDPRWTAARKALIWRLFSGGTIAVAGGSIVAIATLVVLMMQTKQVAQQTQLIAEQNEEFREQNEKLKEQVDNQQHQYDLQRRTEVIAALYERTPIGGPVANRRTRSEALRELVEMERRQKTDGKLLDLRNAQLEGTDLAGMNLSNSDLTGCDLRNANLADCNLSGSDLRATILSGANFPRATLHRVNCEGTDLSNTILSAADFTDANCLAANFSGAEMFKAVLIRANLFGSKGWETATVKLAIFGNNLVNDTNLIERLVQSGAVLLNNNVQSP